MDFLRYLTLCMGVLASCLINHPVAAGEPSKPIPIKAVVVTMFELGEVEGDAAGEFQLWKSGQGLHQEFEFVPGPHSLYLNPETGVLGVVTGVGTAKAAATIMALGLDPRFDLRQAYWLIAGIAGVDPEDASIGSGAWSRWIVDGDLAHHIDSREIPTDWPHGYFPLLSNGLCQDCTQQSENAENRGEVMALNTELAAWAFELTKDAALPDTDAAQGVRNRYEGYPAAQSEPSVLLGDTMSAATFWHGKRNNQWANQWVKFWTNNQGNFVTSAMEDIGTFQSLTYLDQMGKADIDRLMLLRTASNYTHQPPGLSATENLAIEFGPEGFAGLDVAVQSAYQLGSKVIDRIVRHWSVYKDALPYQQKQATVLPADKAEPELDPRLVSAAKLAESLGLQGHIEGGFFRRTFQADHRPMLDTEGGERFSMTSIYYMLTSVSPIGHFHQNQSDIMHFYHAGDPITYHLLMPDGSYQSKVLGPDPDQGHEFQFVVRGGIWKASEIPADGKFGYGLISEAVAPGFDYRDMALADAKALTVQYPVQHELIKRLSKQ